MPRIVALICLVVLTACQTDSSSMVGEKPAGQSAPKGAIEPVTGLPEDALLAVQGLGKQFGIFYLEGEVEQPNLRAAAPRLCRRAGSTVKSTKDVPLYHPEQMPPSTRHFVVYCK